MTPEASAVLNALKPGTLGFDKLSVVSGLEPARLLSTLTILQINGLIETLPGKQYKLMERSDPEGKTWQQSRN